MSLPNTSQMFSRAFAFKVELRDCSSSSKQPRIIRDWELHPVQDTRYNIHSTRGMRCQRDARGTPEGCQGPLRFIGCTCCATWQANTSLISHLMWSRPNLCYMALPGATWRHDTRHRSQVTGPISILMPSILLSIPLSFDLHLLHDLSMTPTLSQYSTVHVET